MAWNIETFERSSAAVLMHGESHTGSDVLADSASASGVNFLRQHQRSLPSRQPNRSGEILHHRCGLTCWRTIVTESWSMCIVPHLPFCVRLQVLMWIILWCRTVKFGTKILYKFEAYILLGEKRFWLLAWGHKRANRANYYRTNARFFKVGLGDMSKNSYLYIIWLICGIRYISLYFVFGINK